MLFNILVAEVPTLFYIQGFKLQGKAHVIEDWKSNLFQIPPSSDMVSQNFQKICEFNEIFFKITSHMKKKISESLIFR